MNYLILESKSKDEPYKSLPITTLDDLQQVTELVELLRIVKKRKYPEYRIKFSALTKKEADKHNAVYKWIYD